MNATMENESSSSNSMVENQGTNESFVELSLDDLLKTVSELVKYYDEMFHQISPVRKYNFQQSNIGVEIDRKSLSFDQTMHLIHITGMIKKISDTLQNYQLRRFHANHKLARAAIPPIPSLSEKSQENTLYLQQQAHLLKDYLLKEVVLTEKKDKKIKTLISQLKEKDTKIDALKKELNQIKSNNSALVSLSASDRLQAKLIEKENLVFALQKELKQLKSSSGSASTALKEAEDRADIPHNSLLITLESAAAGNSSPPTTQSSLSASEETSERKQPSSEIKAPSNEDRGRPSTPLKESLRRSVRKKELMTIYLDKDETEEELSDSDIHSIAESEEASQSPVHKSSSSSTQTKLPLARQVNSSSSSRWATKPLKPSPDRDRSRDTPQSEEQSEGELREIFFPDKPRNAINEISSAGKIKKNFVADLESKKFGILSQIKTNITQSSVQKESLSQSTTPTSSVLSVKEKDPNQATPSRKRRSGTLNNDIAHSYANRKKKKTGKPTLSAATRASIDRCQHISRETLKAMLGRFIQRFFEDGLFYGVISRYRMPYFLIIYEDGDREELDYLDLQQFLVADDTVAKNRRINCLNEAKKHGFLEDDIPHTNSPNGSRSHTRYDEAEGENSTTGEKKQVTVKNQPSRPSIESKNKVQNSRSDSVESTTKRKRGRQQRRRAQSVDESEGAISLSSDSESNEDNQSESGSERRPHKKWKTNSTNRDSDQLDEHLGNEFYDSSAQKLDILTAGLIKSSIKSLSEDKSSLTRGGKYFWNSPSGETSDHRIAQTNKLSPGREDKNKNTNSTEDGCIDLTQNVKNRVPRRSMPRSSSIRRPPFSSGESSTSESEDDTNYVTSKSMPSPDKSAEIIQICDSSSDEEIASLPEENAFDDEVSFIINKK